MKIQTAPLSRDEFIGLMRMAERESRTPNEQLRHLLRKALSVDSYLRGAEPNAGGERVIVTREVCLCHA